MCTVSYIPTSGTSFILTSNRDERISRAAAIKPLKYTINNQSVLFPKDPEANGTWIATGAGGFTLCLLNGGLIPHIPTPPYRQSRGKVVTDFFVYCNIDTFIKEYSFTDIEPFTLIIIHSNCSIRGVELRWDGKTLHSHELDTTVPKIWSSVTLYTPDVIVKRENWFKRWLQTNTDIDEEQIVDFHRFTGEGDIKNDLIMQREDGKQTVSITSVVQTDGSVSMNYIDLTIGNESKSRLFYVKNC